MKKIIILSLLSVALVGSPVFAQTEDAVVPVINAETVTNADLGISNPGLLPTNPFYFLKEFGRAVRRAVTFDSVKEAELELNITNEKAAELKQVEENQPENTDAIQSAIQNYQENQQRMVEKFENLKETSSNPNVEKLLQTFADRAVKHAKVFDELQNKFENQSQISGEISQVREMASNVVAAASAKDDPVKFAAKIEQVLAIEKGSEMKNVRSIEILDNFIKNASDEVRVSLEKVREDVSARLQIDMKNAVQTQGAETVRQAIINLPGDAAHRTVILKELEQKSGTAVSRVLESAVTTMNKEIISSENIMEKAREQLQRAGDVLSKLANRLNENALPAQAGQPPVNVRELYEKARNAYAKAKAAFEEKKYGEAFGQATSAEMAARNALRALEEKIIPQADSLRVELDRLEMTLAKYADVLNSRNLTVESNPKAYEFIARIKELLSLARNAYAKNDSESVKNYIKQIKDYLNNLVQFIEGDVRVENKVPELKAIVPTLTKFIYKNSLFRTASWQCYDGKEFSNDKSSACKSSEEWQAEAKKFCDGHCYADNSKCGVNSWGVSNECGAEDSAGWGKTIVPVPATSSGGATSIICAKEYNPVCGGNGRTYANPCVAKASGADIKFIGECNPPIKEAPDRTDPTTSSDTTGVICTQEYAPVCAEVKIVCVRAPCDPINKTFSNSCMAKAAGASVLYGGECGGQTNTTSSGSGSVVTVPTVSSGATSVGVGIANPASTYCVQKGYKNTIRTSSDGSQYGACVFPNGKECEEWKFYRGECVADANTAVFNCGTKPVLPATPANCKYDGPYCVSGKWDYKLICADASGVSEVPSVAVPAIAPARTDSAE